MADRFAVGRGDRVAIAARNYPEWALAFWATVKLGAVAVPLNAWWTGPELTYAIGHSRARVMFADHERLERLAPHLPELDLAGVVDVRAELDDLVTAGKGQAVPVAEVGPDDDVTILYTSGTTGRPKGAAGTHRNICNFVWNGLYAQASGARPATPPANPVQPVTLLTFPLFHVGGLQSHLVPYTFYGGKLVLMYKWHPDEAIDLIEREAVIAFSGVPTTAFSLLERAAERGVSLDSVAGMSSGATLVPPELVRRIDSQFAGRVAPGNGYGLTETSGAMVFNAGAGYVARPDSVGRPISPVNEVRIVTEDGRDAAPGEVGEIWMKGPTVVRGYFDDPAATAAAFTDGWFHTGDLGRIDDDGLLFVVDRLKDVVIRGGENVYSAEVEAALFEHPDVADAAIVGVPHPALGEEVAAVVRVRNGGDVDEAGLAAHLRQRLAGFKVPSRWWLRSDELPRNAAGKVLKRQLRDELATRR